MRDLQSCSAVRRRIRAASAHACAQDRIRPRRGEGMMFAYVCLGANDLARAAAFYDATLATLGLSRCDTGDEPNWEGWLGWGTYEDNGRRQDARAVVGRLDHRHQRLTIRGAAERVFQVRAVHHRFQIASRLAPTLASRPPVTNVPVAITVFPSNWRDPSGCSGAKSHTSLALVNTEQSHPSSGIPCTR